MDDTLLLESNGSKFNYNKSLLSSDVGDEFQSVLGPEYHHQIRTAILSIMIVASFIGNILMCFHIRRKKRKKNHVHLLFINLAVADLLVTSFAMTSQLVWESMDREWIAGAAFCPIFKVIQTFTMVLSNYLIVTIALDRHVAIVYPLERNPKTKSYLVGAWMASLVPSLPSVYIFQAYTMPSGRVFCVAKFYTSSLSLIFRRFYMGFIFLSVFILPIFIIVGLYARILYVIWTRSRGFRVEHQGDHRPLKNKDFEGSKASNSKIPKAKTKTLKMTLTVVVTFLATCLPYLLQEMIIAFGDPSILNQNVVALTGIISASNSTLNPYIYLLFNSKSRRTTKISRCFSFNICRSQVKSPKALPNHNQSIV